MGRRATVEDRSRSRSATPVVVVAVVLAAFYVSVNLAQFGWDPAGIPQFGEGEQRTSEYAERVFGRSVPLAPELGHDGRFFFIQAMDPLLLSPADNAALLDRPSYRAQRMLYPTLAWLIGLGRPSGIVVAMVGINLVFYGLGTWVTAAVARQLGVSRWWALGFALNPGTRYELEIAGAGVMALALLMVAVWAVGADRDRLAVVAAVAAVLTREVMLVGIAGLAVYEFLHGRRRRAAWLTIPTIGAVAVWAGYVHLRLTAWDPPVVVEELGAPLVGFVHAMRRWLDSPDIGLLVGAGYLLLCVAFVIRAVRDRSLLAFVGVGFAAFAVLLTEQVWLRQYDITRALSPVLPLYLLMIAVGGRRPVEPSVVEAAVP